MARVLRNFRYRTLPGLMFLDNVRYVALLDNILALDDEFYKFPDSSVPSLQTLCIKWVVRRSSVLFKPYLSCSTEQLLYTLPPGPFDSLPPLLCDLLCDLLQSLREPESTTTPLYCVISPYARCLTLREPLTKVAVTTLETLLAARVHHLVELTWMGAPLTQRLFDYLVDLPALATLITEELVDPINVRELLRRCPTLRTLQLRDGECVRTLAKLNVIGHQVRDLRLLEDLDVSVSLTTIFTVFPSLEQLCLKPTRPKEQWHIAAGDLISTESEPWFDSLKELMLMDCKECEVLRRPLKVLRRLTLERCDYFLEDLAVHPLINFVSLIQCRMHHRGSSADSPPPVVPTESLHLETSDAANPDTTLTPSALIFPRLRRLALSGDVRAVSPAGRFEELCELRYSFESSVLAERVLAQLPLAQLEKLSLTYQAYDDTPLALETLSRCSRLTELQLDGFSELSIPRGLQLPAVRQLRLCGGTVRPRVIQWLMDALPGLRCLQLVELTIRADWWTPWFRAWRQAGIEVELEGGCSIPSWRRSSFRGYAMEF